jgi:hypothetical protein
MKVKDLIELLRETDPEAEAVVTGLDGVGFCPVNHTDALDLVPVEAYSHDFERPRDREPSPASPVSGARFRAVFIG